jgi:hypothetical protein
MISIAMQKVRYVSPFRNACPCGEMSIYTYQQKERTKKNVIRFEVRSVSAYKKATTPTAAPTKAATAQA